MYGRNAWITPACWARARGAMHSPPPFIQHSSTTASLLGNGCGLGLANAWLIGFRGEQQMAVEQAIKHI